MTLKLCKRWMKNVTNNMPLNALYARHVYKPEIDMGWVHPWVALGWVKVYRVAQKLSPFLYALTLNINRFSQLFHCQNQEKICNNTVTKDPTKPQVCRYTTLWNVKYMLQRFIDRSVASPAWVRRLAARRTHWTFDVWTARCELL